MTAPTKDEVAELFRVHYGPEAAAERGRRADAFDDTRTWVDPNGYRLSDRLWKQKAWVRSQIDEVLKEAIRTGEDALLTAKKLEEFLDPLFSPTRNLRGRIVRGQARAIVTHSPGRGGSGSLPARRLARTEISRAHFAGTQFAAERTPFAVGWKYNLSGRHPKSDPCDAAASHDSGKGPGIYSVNQGPRLPMHPNCLCHASVEVEKDTEKIVRELKEMYDL